MIRDLGPEYSSVLALPVLDPYRGQRDRGGFLQRAVSCLWQPSGQGDHR